MGPSETCNLILSNIKDSNLHFILKENPFSAQITLRKKFINDQHRHQLFQVENGNVFVKKEAEREVKEKLEKSIAILVNENHNLNETVDALQTDLENANKAENAAKMRPKHL